MNHRYILEPYSDRDSRFMCPNCRHRRDTFTRYIDTETNTYLAGHVGRCDRQEKCGYHYPPRRYFADNPGLAPAGSSQSAVRKNRSANCQLNTAKSLLPWALVEQTMRAYHRNNFVQFLAKLFGEPTARDLVNRYCIGTASHWPGATVFWQLDYHDRVRTGKIMLYNRTDGHRVKNPFNHISWVHALLSRESKVLSPQSKYDFRLQTEDFRLKQCFFGEHLLANDPHKIVALAESEKTAIIGSAMEPNYIWLAAGSLEGLTQDKCKVLHEREVRMFPDVNAYDRWKLKAREMNLHFPAAKFGVYKPLKTLATPYERSQGIDIADRWIEQLTINK